MIVACATDENYAEMAGVLLRSLALNGDVADARIVLIGDTLGTETIEALAACADGLNFEYVDLATARGEIGTLPISFYSTAIHIRLLLPQLIPGGGRVLYLDSDIIVNRSLRPLDALSLDGFLAAAAEDRGRPEVRAFANARLGRPPDVPYFNSGVLLFDLDDWRRHDVGGECIRLIANRDDFWPDQDALNLVLDGRIKTLDRAWNFFSHDLLPREEYAAANLVHFIPEKPVSLNCRHPMLDAYMALRDTTPWRGRPFTSSVRERRISLIGQMAAARIKRWKERE